MGHEVEVLGVNDLGPGGEEVVHEPGLDAGLHGRQRIGVQGRFRAEALASPLDEDSEDRPLLDVLA